LICGCAVAAKTLLIIIAASPECNDRQSRTRCVADCPSPPPRGRPGKAGALQASGARTNCSMSLIGYPYSGTSAEGCRYCSQPSLAPADAVWPAMRPGVQQQAAGASGRHRHEGFITKLVQLLAAACGYSGTVETGVAGRCHDPETAMHPAAMFALIVTLTLLAGIALLYNLQ
jgi:hypothetical protein